MVDSQKNTHSDLSLKGPKEANQHTLFKDILKEGGMITTKSRVVVTWEGWGERCNHLRAHETHF